MATSPRTQKSSATPRRAAGGRRKKAASRKRRAAGKASGVSRNVDATVSDIDRLRDDLVRLSRSVSSLMSTRTNQARDLVSETASDYYESGLDYAREAETQVRGMANDVAKQIERNPLAAVGIVFGVGYLIGMMRRR